MRTPFVSCVVALTALSGCSYFDRSPHDLGRAKAVYTGPEERLVMATPMDAGDVDAFGRVKPRQIVCAEPSPDVAKAIASSFNAGISVDFQGQAADLPANAKADIAGAVARARSEALAQLTERVPTIQLLRDGLFRACEAYSNGALSPMDYALMLSRYGDVMVTLLGQDLVAGDFGRQLAAVSSAASGSANATAKRDDEDSRNLSRKINQDVADLNQKDAAVAAAKQDAATAPPSEQQTAQDRLNRSVDEQQQATRKLLVDLSASATATTSATATPAGAFTAQNIAADRAQVIAGMQREFMTTPSMAALAVACITALDRSYAADMAASGASAGSGGARPSSADVRPTALAQLCNGLPVAAPSASAPPIVVQGLRPPAAGDDRPRAGDSSLPPLRPGAGLLEVVARETGVALRSGLDRQDLSSAPRGVQRLAQQMTLVRNAVNDAAPPRSAEASPKVVASIRKLQELLIAAGFTKVGGADGKPDGKLGPRTRDALRDFQKARGLPATGVPDDRTVEALEKAA